MSAYEEGYADGQTDREMGLDQTLNPESVDGEESYISLYRLGYKDGLLGKAKRSI